MTMRVSETNPDDRMLAYHTLSPAYQMVGGFNCSEIVKKGEWVFDKALQRWNQDPIQAQVPTPLYEAGHIARKLGVRGLQAALQRWPEEREYEFHLNAHGPAYGVGQPVSRNGIAFRIHAVRLSPEADNRAVRWEFRVDDGDIWYPRAAFQPIYEFNWYEERFKVDRPGRQHA